MTGTLFRRAIDTETPSPVTVVSATQIEQRGLPTIADVVNLLSAANGGGMPQNFNAFASGATAISLRGLTTNSTLTLFDGLRPSYYPLAADGQSSIVDLNTIPSAIVDRVEVLKDGASSTYGADAIAGVVNVILKKEITGIQGRVETGVSQYGDAPEQRLQLTAGFGKLNEQGFNIYVSGEYWHNSVLYNNQRGFPYNTSDLTSIKLPDGSTGRNGNTFFLPPSASSTGGATVGVVVPATFYVDPLTGLPFGTQTPDGLYQVLGSCASQNLVTHNTSLGSWCEQDITKQYSVVQPEQTHIGGTLHATVNIGSNAQAYFVATFYQSRVLFPGAPSSIRTTRPITTLNIALPPTLSDGSLNPQDPFAAQGEAALLYYRFGDIPASTEDLSRTYRVASGIDGKIGDTGIGYSVAATYMRTDLTQTRTGLINVPGLTKAINDGTYNFIDPSQNSQAIRNQISPTLQNYDNSELWQLQAVFTKDLVDLPGGPLQLGVGGQIRYEAVYDPNPVPLRDFYSVNPFSAVGNRYVKAAFFELNAPVLTQLELNASGRFDSYTSGFSHFSPKIGFKFTPVKALAIRGTYSQGFRAPSIPELSGAVLGFTGYTPGDGLSADDKATLLKRYGNDSYISTPTSLGNNTTGNPNLKPETSRAFTGGIVFEPTRWLTVTADYYNIRKKNLILSTSGSPGAIASEYLLNGDLPAGVTVTPTPADPNNPTLRAIPLSVNFLYSNGQSLQTSGIDLTLQARVKLGTNVRFTSILDGTEILEYKINTGTEVWSYVGTLGSYNATSASGTPRWRANWQNTLDVGQFTGTLTGYFVSGYKGYADDATGAGSTCANAITTSVFYDADGITSTPGGPLQCAVKHWLQFDANLQFHVNDNYTFYFNVTNLFNAHAPFDPNTYGGNNYNPAWAAAGVVGRFFRVGATFKF